MADTDTGDKTPHHELLDLKMVEAGHGTLREYCLKRRGKGVLWRHIARDVWDITGRDVSDGALRQWFGDDDEMNTAFETWFDARIVKTEGDDQ